MYSSLSRPVKQPNTLPIFHPEDKAGFFPDVLNLSQVVADEAVGAAGDAEGAEGDLFDFVAWGAGTDGESRKIGLKEKIPTSWAVVVMPLVFFNNNCMECLNLVT